MAEESDTDDSHEVQLQVLTDTSIGPNITCFERCRLLFCPIKSKEIQCNLDDTQMKLIIVPEAFRMWFYFGYFIFTAVAIITSYNFSNTFSSTDNKIIDTLGGNNVCIFYDFPPFTYFGPTLWFPIVCSILVYELFDYFRCYDAWKDGHIGRTFYIIYTALALFESFSFIWFTQVFATKPEESIYIHTLPFMLICYAFWTLALKRFLYIWRTGKLNGYHTCIYVLGILYVTILLVLVISFTIIVTANLFGAQLWLTPGWKWTHSFLSYISYLWAVFTLVIPIIIYAVITKDLETVTLIFNRTSTN